MVKGQILVVDSNTASRTFLMRLLEQKGYRTLASSLGKEGLIYAWRDRPDLILFDSGLADLGGEAFLYKLRSDRRTARTPIIVLGNSPQEEARYREAGANIYLVKSAEAVPLLLNAIEKLLHPDAEFEAPKPVKGGYLIPFLSAKGGTGTSSLCVNLAMAISLQMPEAQTVVLDSVLPIGSVAAIVGYDGATNLVSISTMPMEQITAAFLREALPKWAAWQFHLLAGSPDPQQAQQLRAEQVEHISKMLCLAYDYIFVDVGRSLSNLVLPIIQQADLIALVISADLEAVRLTRLILKYLQIKGVSDHRLFPILNRVVGFEGVTKADIEGMLNLSIRMTMPYLGGDFSLANNQHVPLLRKFPRETAAMIIKEAASQMVSMAHRARELAESA